MDLKLSGKTTFEQFGEGVTSASATVATPTAGRIFITDIVCSSDLIGAILKIQQGDSSTPFAVVLPGTATPVAFSFSFEIPIIISADNNAVATIDGYSSCQVNILGYVA